MKYVFAALAFLVVIVYSAISLDLLYSIEAVGYYTGEALRYCLGMETEGDWMRTQVGLDMFAFYAAFILAGLIIYILGDGGNGRKVSTLVILMVVTLILLLRVIFHTIDLAREYANFYEYTLVPPLFVALSALAVYLTYKELRDK
jgi:hypothetical protein